MGLWQTESEVDQALLRLKTLKDKHLAISAQLNFRKHVLKQRMEGEPNIYSMTELVHERRKKLSIQTFSENIKKLIRHSYTVQPEGTDDGNVILVGKKVKHAFEENGEKVWYIWACHLSGISAFG